jgi:hypothetical protein
MIDLWHGETAFILFLMATAIVLLLTALRDYRQRRRQSDLSLAEWRRKLLIEPPLEQ